MLRTSTYLLPIIMAIFFVPAKVGIEHMKKQRTQVDVQNGIGGCVCTVLHSISNLFVPFHIEPVYPLQEKQPLLIG